MSLQTTSVCQRCGGIMKVFAAGIAPLIFLTACGPSAPTGSSETAHSSNSSTGKASTTPARQNGPFGLAMGERIEDVSGATQIKPGWYKVNKTPIASSDFDGFLVEAYPETGICFIKGIGPTIEGDSGGSQLRMNIDNIAASMETKYGSPKHTDYCDSESSTCNPGYWTMHISSGSRIYSYSWEFKNPINGIGEAYVGASATSSLEGYAVIEYYSSQKKECKAAAAKAGAAAL